MVITLTEQNSRKKDLMSMTRLFLIHKIYFVKN